MTKRFVALHEPVLAGNEWKYVKDCLDSGWVSTSGGYVTRFENEMARRLGVGHAVAVTNGTAALHLAMRVVGVEAGDEVVVPSLTFIATCNAAVYQGAVPRFVDVEESTFGLDPAALARFLESGTERRDGRVVARDTGRRIAACVPMHALGHPARIDEIVAVCARYGIPVVEDAAEALGTSYKGKAAGTFGRAGILSFNGNKVITTGGGGMLVTDDEALAGRARHLSTQGKKDTERYWHDETGYNYRLPNVNAAIGCAQLEQLDSFLQSKRRLAELYRRELQGASGVRLVWEPADARSNFWMNTVVFESAERAEEIGRRLNAEGFGSRPLWAPCHRQAMFTSLPHADLSVTDRLWRTSLNIPSSANLAEADAKAVVALLRRK